MIGPTQRPLPDITQHSQNKGIHASGGIRIRIPSKRPPVSARRYIVPFITECGVTSQRTWLFMSATAKVAFITQKYFPFQFLNPACLNQNQDQDKENTQNIKDCIGSNVCYLFFIVLTLGSYESKHVAVCLFCGLTAPVAALENHNINTAVNLDAARWNSKH